jgi:hypothetical protein
MTARHNSRILVAREEIVAPPAPRACEDHNWELPNGVYLAMALFFAGAIGVLALGFRSGMGLSYGIIFAFLIAFFGVPASFVRTSRGRGGDAKPLRWAEFREFGIATATGKTPAREATTLVLLLPALIFAWAIAVAVIAALV